MTTVLSPRAAGAGPEQARTSAATIRTRRVTSPTLARCPAGDRPGSASNRADGPEHEAGHANDEERDRRGPPHPLLPAAERAGGRAAPAPGHEEGPAAEQQ